MRARGEDETKLCLIRSKEKRVDSLGGHDRINPSATGFKPNHQQLPTDCSPEFINKI
jgi:hypothetical protein